MNKFLARDSIILKSNLGYIILNLYLAWQHCSSIFHNGGRCTARALNKFVFYICFISL